MLLQVLNLLEGFDVGGMTPNSPEHIHLVVEAFNLAYADRHAFYADPYAVLVPQKGLVSKAYAAERRRLIDLAKAATAVAPGEPSRFDDLASAAPNGGGSTPPTIGKAERFQMDMTAIVVVGGKIPRVTPAPSLALKDGAPVMAWTTPGEDVQMQANLQVFFNVVHFGMDPQDAVEAPRFRSLHGPAAQYPQEVLPAHGGARFA